MVAVPAEDAAAAQPARAAAADQQQQAPPPPPPRARVTAGAPLPTLQQHAAGAAAADSGRTTSARLATAAPQQQQQHAAGAAAAPAGRRTTSARLAYVDWLRAALTALVLVHHCVYNFYGAVRWLGIPHQPPFDLTTVGAAFFQRGNQSNFMGLFFFLSGLFTPGSLRRKGSWRYLGDRALRLLLPVAVYDLVIAPVILIIARGAVVAPGSPPVFGDVPSAAALYRGYFYHYRRLAANPMWFVVQLFIFDLFFVGLSAAAGTRWGRKLLSACCRCCCTGGGGGGGNDVATVAAAPVAAPVKEAAAVAAVATDSADCEKGAAPPLAAAAADGNGNAENKNKNKNKQSADVYSTRFMLTALAVTALALSLAAFLVRLGWRTADFTSVGLQIPVGYLITYVTAYSYGVAAYHANALPRLPARLGWISLACSALWWAGGWMLGWLVAGGRDEDWLPVLIGGGAGTPVGFQAYFAFYEQIFAVFWSFGLLVAFREVVGGRTGGKVGRVIVGAAYTAYILHPLVIVSYDRALIPLYLQPAAAAAVLAALVVPTTWIVAALVREIPGAKRVL